MLKEILGVADDGAAKRRWFHDEYFDLFVWQSQGEVTLFQDADIGDAVVAQEFQNMSKHNLIDEWQHRLGTAHGQRAQPRTCASGHDNSFHAGVSSK